MQKKDLIPITLLTGHLGSGKTTALNAYLAAPDSEPALVIINEFGDVGLDHLLVRETTESVVLLENGCLCCAVREDLVTTLRDLAKSLRDRTVPPFSRVIIETTGLADPVPVIHSLMSDLYVMLSFRLARVVTLVDAVNGPSVIERFPEALRQVSLADTVVLTKGDLADPERIAQLEGLIRSINPRVPVVVKSRDALERAVFETDSFDVHANGAAVDGWLTEDPRTGKAPASTHSVQSFCIERRAPMSWDVVANWIGELAGEHGPRLLRIKGIVAIEGSELPYVVHGIQHLFHPPEILENWPSQDRLSRIVFIVDGLTRDDVEAILARHEERHAASAPVETVLLRVASA